MPAVSEAQRRYLNVHFGHAWTKRHHFDTKGPLPKRKDRRQRLVEQFINGRKIARSRHGGRHGGRHG